MSDSTEKLSEKVEVRTFLTQIHCPNKSCGEVLSNDGGTRNVDGLHGGPLEYRHRCGKCGAGYWLKSVYPKVSYEPIKTGRQPMSREIQTSHVPEEQM